MSADNWAVCPGCFKTAEDTHTEALRKLHDDLYGKVPPKEFLTAAVEIKAPARVGFPRNFREDYEVYNDDRGTVTIDYSGHCTQCGLAASHEHTIDLERR